ncbi:DNA replication complex GINS family protein [Candidatus Bathyarchaeota archaeon]|nr:DNA replication complex GINS family protein [Candidatus Bathyarchaeota archaeon]
MTVSVDPILKAEFEFENSEITVVSTRDLPEMELGGVKVGPFEEGKEYKVMFWVARELVKAGLAQVRSGELLDSIKLYKIHWTERVQPTKQVSPLPQHFYPLLRWYLDNLKNEMSKNPEKVSEYEKARKLSQDILSCRLRKVVVLASSMEAPMRVVQNLTEEEKWLYQKLHRIIEDWRNRILSLEVGE